MPSFAQLFVAGEGSRVTGMALERLAFCLRKRAESETDVYFPSLSSRTLIYKGMLTTHQLDEVFPDLRDERVASALAVVHSRFSTNTFPSWPLATRSASSPTTARSTPSWATATGCGPARRCSPPTWCRATWTGSTRSAPRRVGLGVVRRGARAAAHGRALAAALGADDDPRGVGEPRRDGRPAARVLRVPLVGDGAVGRPRLRRVHRRRPGRRGARPQRPASQPLLGHRRRAGGAGVRGRRPRPRPGDHRAQGPAPARPDVPRRHRPSTGSSRTTRSSPSSPPSTPTPSGCTPA